MKKGENWGTEELIPKSEWVPTDKICGSVEPILNHPIMIKAQEVILERFIPKHRIAFVSLCTKTRPYEKGRKWRTFLSELSDVDFIICSSGGMIPIQYGPCYPFTVYDTTDEDIMRHYLTMYQVYVRRSVVRFFSLVKYDYIVFNFRPNLINHEIGVWAGNLLLEFGHIKGYSILPDEVTYKKAQQIGFAKLGLSMYPDLHPVVLDSMKEKIAEYKSKLTKDSGDNMSRNTVLREMPKDWTENTSKLSRATANFWAFSVMVKTVLNGNKKWTITEIVYDKWERAFPGEDFPIMSLHKAILKIQYKLLAVGYANEDIKMDRKLKQNYQYYVLGIGSPCKEEKFYNTWPGLSEYRKVVLDHKEF